MISDELITLNEIKNDGSMIHVYYDSTLGVWAAYGFSAFAAMTLCKANDIACMESYSATLQMPSVVMPSPESLISGATLVTEAADYRALKLPQPASGDYVSWAYGLRTAQ